MPAPNFLDSVVQQWEKLRSRLGGEIVRSEVKWVPDRTKMAIEIKTHNYLALIEAWEHAHCLDITVLPIARGEGRVLCAGECVASTELEQRLALLRNALLQNP